ncbi:hypothetical protein GPECTOR_213g431 [Gonium pectorale]|uniref:Uncharacterized protein n=1 Tax=Gonium pectorale TaxID=33097 RepID=A0A150FWS6_GONPE|nr:hypothetical protein GPECTOR_213g431 [Gonium pectorale]|eukprot:KXZ42061.1 hypothetical protein GPECTOR_213g431 [Gonium pectorale]
MAPAKPKPELPDWVSLVDGSDPRPFLLALQIQLQSSRVHYKAMHQSLAAVFFRRVDPEMSLDFMLLCLERLVLEGGAVLEGGDCGAIVTCGANADAVAASAPSSLPGEGPAILTATDAASGLPAPADATAPMTVDADADADGADADGAATPGLAADAGSRSSPADSWPGTLSHLLLEVLAAQRPPPAPTAATTVAASGSGRGAGGSGGGRDRGRDRKAAPPAPPPPLTDVATAPEAEAGPGPASGGCLDLGSLLPPRRPRLLRLFVLKAA